MILSLSLSLAFTRKSDEEIGGDRAFKCPRVNNAEIRKKIRSCITETERDIHERRRRFC